jgi:hypothetical protein
MNDSIKIRLAIIATGGRAGLVRWLIQNRKDIAITAVYDPDKERAAQALKDWEVTDAVIFDSYEAAIQRDDVDWVMIFSPNAFHKEHVLCAFAAGKHVFCEKPLATEIDDCQEIFEAHQASGLTFATGFVLRYAPLYRKVKAGRPWVIVVTSDHGEMLGDHGFFRKCQPYEGSAHIPMMISASSELGFVVGGQADQVVCLEDLMPTLLEVAGAAIPAYLDGVSLVPILRGEAQATREWLHMEHAPTYSQAQAYHALTDGRFKYIWRTLDGSEQLFDLDRDPGEELDLAQNSYFDAMLETWRERLIQRLAGRPEGFVQSGTLVPDRPYQHLNNCTVQSNQETNPRRQE